MNICRSRGVPERELPSRSPGAAIREWSEKRSSRPEAGHDEAGAVLVLALLFLAVVGAIVGSLATWATNDLNNTAHFTSARTLQYAANGATQVAIQNIRYTPLLATTVPPNSPTWPGGTGPGSCWASGAPVQIDNQSMDVFCTTVYTPTSASTRVVTFDTCLDGGTAAQCIANPLLEAVVTFDDYPTGSSPPNTAACVVYCGTSMTVNSWVWSP
jgi:hypothetical protein